MTIVILFGTESGTAEFVAGDLAEWLSGQTDAEVVECDLAEYSPGELSPEHFYILVSSTYGEGELPASAREFHADVSAEQPELHGLRYAVFGLGDSSYPETYNYGSKILDETFTGLGATRVGSHGLHDAMGRETASDVAQEWLEELWGELGADEGVLASAASAG